MTNAITFPAGVETESHMIYVDVEDTWETCQVYFEAPYYIEADLGERLIRVHWETDYDRYDITMETYLGTLITYTVEIRVTETEENDEGVEIPSVAKASITHD
jgi:hypothetical protein